MKHTRHLSFSRGDSVQRSRFSQNKVSLAVESSFALNASRRHLMPHLLSPLLPLLPPPQCFNNPPHTNTWHSGEGEAASPVAPSLSSTSSPITSDLSLPLSLSHPLSLSLLTPSLPHILHAALKSNPSGGRAPESLRFKSLNIRRASQIIDLMFVCVLIRAFDIFRLFLKLLIFKVTSTQKLCFFSQQ